MRTSRACSLRHPPPVARAIQPRDSWWRASVQMVSSYLVDPGFWRLPLLKMRATLAATPTWISHMTGNAVLDGDGVLLFGQARPPGASQLRGRMPGALRLAARRARCCLSAQPVGAPGPAAAYWGLVGSTGRCARGRLRGRRCAAHRGRRARAIGARGEGHRGGEWRALEQELLHAHPGRQVRVCRKSCRMVCVREPATV